MAITKLPPNTIHLSGPLEVWDEFPASEAITPGQLIELHSDSGTLSWRKNSAAADQAKPFVALERIELNHGIDTAYAIGDQVKAGVMGPGTVFYGLLPSGQDIAVADYLQSNGDGLLKEATATTATANVARYQALEALGVITADTRCRAILL